MAKQIIKGALLGGITYFIWMNISWMGIGWHSWYMKSFSEGSTIGEVLKSSAPEAGIYPLPDPKYCSSPDQMMQKMAQGPYAYMMVRPAGLSANMGTMMLFGFLAALLLCAVATYLLANTTGLSFVQKVGFVKLTGLLGTSSVYFGQWNWWGFPNTYLLINLLDQGIAWGLVGLVLAKFVVK